MMVDALQRLAVEYHFENEVEALLEVQRSMSSSYGDLHEKALRFLLLRQEDYNVPFGNNMTYVLDHNMLGFMLRI